MKLSVVVLAGADAHSVKRCIDGFAAQAEGVAELLVPLASGSAETQEWLDDAERWPFPVEAVELPPQAELSAAAIRNLAVARTHAELILFADAHSIPAPGVVAGHIAAHIRSGSARTIVGRRTTLASTCSTPLLRTLEESRDRMLFERNPQESDAGWPAFHAGHLSAPRGVLQQNVFDERFQTGRFSDLEFGYRLACTGHSIEYRSDLITWHDEVLDLAAIRERYRSYGSEIALFHRIHSDERLANQLGVREAREAEQWLTEAVAVAEESIPRLEEAVDRFDLRSQNTRRCFGALQAERMLAECYATLVRFELIQGVRVALDLAPLSPAESPPATA